MSRASGYGRLGARPPYSLLTGAFWNHLIIILLPPREQPKIALSVYTIAGGSFTFTNRCVSLSLVANYPHPNSTPGELM